MSDFDDFLSQRTALLRLPFQPIRDRYPELSDEEFHERIMNPIVLRVWEETWKIVAERDKRINDAAERFRKGR